MIGDFINWFEADSPNFVVKYGNAIKFYDKDSDEFHIQEIQDAYEDFKQGSKPNTLYYSWGG
ncbi:MAG: hypothetical protein ABS863_00430 [Aerococcus urinaeequi]